VRYQTTILAATRWNHNVVAPVIAAKSIAKLYQQAFSGHPIDSSVFHLPPTTGVTHTFFVEYDTRTLIRNDATSAILHFIWQFITILHVDIFQRRNRNTKGRIFYLHLALLK
jgi:hypothetical protein